VFVDSMPVRDRIRLADTVNPDCSVHVMESRGPNVSMCWSTDWRQRRLYRLTPLPPSPTETPAGPSSEDLEDGLLPGPGWGASKHS
jgi:hypothetical protein